MKHCFYTLLYVDNSEKKKMSLTGLSKAKELTFKERINIFLRCAALLNKSLIWNQVGELNILTNDSEFVMNSLCEIGCQVNVIEICFSLCVPRNIYFYSAHYKIDVFKYLGEKSNDEMSFLLDNDVVCTGSLPHVIKEIENADYSDKKHPLLIYSMPRYHGERMVIDKKKVDASQIHGLWAGGEFIAGVSSAFAELYKEVIKIQDGYWKCYPTLFHQGDEMLVSVALENMLYKCICPIIDAHGLGLVKRYWSILGNEPYYKEDFWLAHLPYDKGMISALNIDKINSNQDFLNAYKSYWYQLSIKKFFRNKLIAIKGLIRK